MSVNNLNFAKKNTTLLRFSCKKTVSQIINAPIQNTIVCEQANFWLSHLNKCPELFCGLSCGTVRDRLPMGNSPGEEGNYKSLAFNTVSCVITL